MNDELHPQQSASDQKATPPYTTLTAPLPTSKRKPYWTIALVVGSILFTVLSYTFVYILVTGAIKPTSSPDLSTQTIISEPDSANELIDEAISNAGISEKYDRKGFTAVYRKIPGYEFKVPSTVADTPTTLAHIPDDEYETKKAGIQNYFNNHNYVMSDNGNSGAGKSYSYDGHAYSCRFDEWGASNVVDRGLTRSILLTCASVDDIAINASGIKPFYDMLKVDPSVDKSSIKMFKVNIIPGKTEGYSVFTGASVERKVGESRTPYAIFYRTPDNEWFLTYRAVGGLLCSDINNPHALKAFAGEKCFESNGKTKRDL